jgi:hypothetical protein
MREEEFCDLPTYKKKAEIVERFPELAGISVNAVYRAITYCLPCSFKHVTYLHSKANDYYNRILRRFVSLTLLRLHQLECTLIYLDEFGIGSKTLKRRGWGFTS